MDNKLRRIIYAICADYNRRAKLLQRGRLPIETAATYARWNAAIDLAVAKHAEPGERSAMMKALQNRRGYNEASDHCGKNQFYKRKTLIVEEIAEALNLL